MKHIFAIKLIMLCILGNAQFNNQVLPDSSYNTIGIYSNQYIYSVKDTFWRKMNVHDFYMKSLDTHRIDGKPKNIVWTDNGWMKVSSLDSMEVPANGIQGVVPVSKGSVFSSCRMLVVYICM